MESWLTTTVSSINLIKMRGQSKVNFSGIKNIILEVIYLLKEKNFFLELCKLIHIQYRNIKYIISKLNV